ncbi:hypothetical protein EON63_06685 [archaeon]|nr:MAG: hypothetical protein EON63_06685 [archaeon]
MYSSVYDFSVYDHEPIHIHNHTYTAYTYPYVSGACHAILTGHEGEISKVAFNPQGSRVLTASSDKTARIWETETGDCLQVGIGVCACVR